LTSCHTGEKVNELQLIILETLAVVTLAVHLWCVNLSSAVPLLAILLQWLARRHESPALERHARGMGILGMSMLLAGALAGLALAGIMWLQGDRGLFAMLPRFGERIHWASWELAFYLLCLSIYVALFARNVSGRVWTRPTQTLVAVLASANLLYHFPPLFAVLASVADAPEVVSSSIGPREFRGLMYRPPIIAMTIHFALASLAVGAAVMMHRLAHDQTRDDNRTPLTRGVRMGATVALAATALQLLVGLWLLVSLSSLAQSRLMGRDLVGSSGLALSVLLTFWLLHRLANACFSDSSVAEIRGTLVILVLIVLMMTATLRRAEKGRPLPAVSAAEQCRWPIACC
jgi:hypothetical protein